MGSVLEKLGVLIWIAWN